MNSSVGSIAAVALLYCSIKVGIFIEDDGVFFVFSFVTDKQNEEIFLVFAVVMYIDLKLLIYKTLEDFTMFIY